MEHEIKILPRDYARISDGSKTFHVEHNANGYQCGDIVILREWDPTPINPTDKKQTPKGYTDRPDLTFKLGFVQLLDRDQLIFSLLPHSPAKKKAKA